MKKKLILLALVTTVLFNGCSKNGSENKNSMTEKKEKVTEERVAEEPEPSKPDFDVIMSVDADASLMGLEYNIEDFNESDAVEAIIKGRVRNIEYPYVEDAYSLLDVEILECYKGDLEGNIKIYEEGGYASLEDVKHELEGHMDFSQFTKEEMKNKYIDYTFMGADHSEIGDVFICYIQKTEPPFEAGSYQMVSCVFGRYTLEDNEYVRPEIDFGGKDEDETEEEYQKRLKEEGAEEVFETEIEQEDMEEVLEETFD